MTKSCKCGVNNWDWFMDSLFRSWIKCKSCGDSMFNEGIGVILIDWDVTDIRQITVEAVLRSNNQNGGIVEEKSKMKAEICNTCRNVRPGGLFQNGGVHCGEGQEYGKEDCEKYQLERRARDE